MNPTDLYSSLWSYLYGRECCEYKTDVQLITMFHVKSWSSFDRRRKHYSYLLMRPTAVGEQRY